jgi:hypothetical protein
MLLLRLELWAEKSRILSGLLALEIRVRERYIPGKHVEVVKDCLKTFLTRLTTWFGDLGLALSANKSEMMVFPGNKKIFRFRCGLVRLHFEMSLNLNIWE